MLLPKTLLFFEFLVLDILLFYIFFKCILLFLLILITFFCFNNKIKKCFYLFLYTLLGSLFLLLFINTIFSKKRIEYNSLSKTSF